MEDTSDWSDIPLNLRVHIRKYYCEGNFAFCINAYQDLLKNASWSCCDRSRIHRDLAQSLYASKQFRGALEHAQLSLVDEHLSDLKCYRIGFKAAAAICEWSQLLDLLRHGLRHKVDRWKLATHIFEDLSIQEMPDGIVKELDDILGGSTPFQKPEVVELKSAPTTSTSSKSKPMRVVPKLPEKAATEVIISKKKTFNRVSTASNSKPMRAVPKLPEKAATEVTIDKSKTVDPVPTTSTASKSVPEKAATKVTIDKNKTVDPVPTTSTASKSVPEKAATEVNMGKNKTVDPDYQKYKDVCKAAEQARSQNKWSLPLFQEALRLSKKIPVSEENDRNIVLLKYIISEELLSTAEYKKIGDAIKLLEEIADHGRTIPAIFICMTRAYLLLHKYEMAKQWFVRLEYLVEGVTFPRLQYPETLTNLPASSTEFVLDWFQKLTEECREHHPPDKVCRYEACEAMQDVIFPSKNIYFKSSDFKGCVTVKCADKCDMGFHPVCWGSWKKELGLKNKTDQAVLGMKCPTSDCNGILISMQHVAADLKQKDLFFKGAREVKNEPVKEALKAKESVNSPKKTKDRKPPADTDQTSQKKKNDSLMTQPQPEPQPQPQPQPQPMFSHHTSTIDRKMQTDTIETRDTYSNTDPDKTLKQTLKQLRAVEEEFASCQKKHEKLREKYLTVKSQLDEADARVIETRNMERAKNMNLWIEASGTLIINWISYCDEKMTTLEFLRNNVNSELLTQRLNSLLQEWKQKLAQVQMIKDDFQRESMIPAEAHVRFELPELPGYPPDEFPTIEVIKLMQNSQPVSLPFSWQLPPPPTGYSYDSNWLSALTHQNPPIAANPEFNWPQHANFTGNQVPSVDTAQPAASSNDLLPPITRSLASNMSQELGVQRDGGEDPPYMMESREEWKIYQEEVNQAIANAPPQEDDWKDETEEAEYVDPLMDFLRRAKEKARLPAENGENGDISGEEEFEEANGEAGEESAEGEEEELSENEESGNEDESSKSDSSGSEVIYSTSTSNRYQNLSSKTPAVVTPTEKQFKAPPPPPQPQNQQVVSTPRQTPTAQKVPNPKPRSRNPSMTSVTSQGSVEHQVNHAAGGGVVIPSGSIYAKLVRYLISQPHFSPNSEDQLRRALEEIRKANRVVFKTKSMPEILALLLAKLSERGERRVVLQRFTDLAWGSSGPRKTNPDLPLKKTLGDCSICLESLNGRIDIMTLKCSHVFCTLCLKQWLKSDHSCPLCREYVITHEEFPALSS